MMKEITILALRDTFALTVIGPMDVFFSAGRLWNQFHGLPVTPFFNVKIASLEGKPIKCQNHFYIQPHLAINDVEHTDIIIIPSIANIEKTIETSQTIIDWLYKQYHRGVIIASICTGAFMMAATGLLDKKIATTHWAYIDLFKEMFPRVKVKPERLITDDSGLICAGGLSAGIDLPIYLVEKFCGHEVAVQCSKTLLHGMDQNSQTAYMAFQFPKNHLDKKIRLVQKWIEKHYAEKIDFSKVSKMFGMSRRTFERRFKRATGDTPLEYLQRIRVEIAKKLLETQGKTFDEICFLSGYESSNHFRKLFRKYTGLLPMEYQNKFRHLL